MAKKKISDVPKRAKRLRNGDPDSFEWQHDLRVFFLDRVEYIKRYGKRIGDFMELSPMGSVPVWRDDPDPVRLSVLSKRERATRKGRHPNRRQRDRYRTKAFFAGKSA